MSTPYDNLDPSVKRRIERIFNEYPPVNTFILRSMVNFMKSPRVIGPAFLPRFYDEIAKFPLQNFDTSDPKRKRGKGSAKKLIRR